jgi:hypothetical protein
VKRSVRKMLRQKQEWLGFSERVKAAWEELGMNLCDWLVAQLRQYLSLRACQQHKGPSRSPPPSLVCDTTYRRKLDPAQVGDMWPQVWTRFLRECNKSDVISLDGESL